MKVKMNTNKFVIIPNNDELHFWVYFLKKTFAKEIFHIPDIMFKFQEKISYFICNRAELEEIKYEIEKYAQSCFFNTFEKNMMIYFIGVMDALLSLKEVNDE